MAAELINCSPAEYHNLPGVSNSQLNVFLDPDRGPAKYFDTYIAKTLEAPKTDALIFGQLVHDDVLLGKSDLKKFLGGTVARWEPVPALTESRLRQVPPDHVSHSGSRYWYSDDGVIRCSNHWTTVGMNYWTGPVVDVANRMLMANQDPWVTGFCPWDGFIECRGWKWIPPCVLNADGHKKGAAWTAWAKSNSGLDLLKLDQVDELLGTVAGLRANPLAKRLLYDEPGEPERGIQWIDEETGLTCRARIDKLLNGSLSWIIDLKTALSVSHNDFAASAWAHGYHRQVAFYRRAVKALTGEEMPFVFVVVAKKPPHECELIELDEEFVAMGEQQVTFGLRRLAECLETGRWTASRGEIARVGAPRYAKFEQTV